MVRPIIVACLFTVAVETPIVAWIYRNRRLKMAITAAITTGITNLAMNGVLPGWAPSAFVYLVLGETAALLVEALVYARVEPSGGAGQALIASAVANSASFGLGLVLTPWIFQ
jgi:hypothetical protein